ncbi:MAG TPA: tryptophan--tRNA ligase [Candidatus Paceibacterota bacterium]|mgnify:FL=1|nr:tryptophan--tRNA ligase [Candidatus Paceibacterota bacterium]
MPENNKKVLLSGVKPTGRPHIGNYFGAMKQFVDLQADYKSYIFIADLHALTTARDPKQLRADTLDLAIDYLAIGLDPEKVVFFKQSDVAEHTELAWIFNCLTTMPFLARAHAFKDAEVKNKEVNVGLFDYPLLMAADILLYDTDVVPVGQDQKQHVEITRDTAEKFNFTYGETFKLPEPLIMDEVKTLPGLDGQKMSKSYSNTIPLFADEKEIKRLVMTIKTDSKDVSEPKNPEECNVFALHKLFSGEQLSELKKRYVEGGIGYKESKEILAENMNKYLAPMREKRAEIAKDPDQVLQILKNGANSAREQAKLKMKEVRERVGTDL